MDLDEIKKRPYVSSLERLQTAISALEGWAFGKRLRFAVISRTLHIDDGGWKELREFREVPGLDNFAKELDEAVAPVCERYAKFLRQEMANECVEVAAKALDKDAR